MNISIKDLIKKIQDSSKNIQREQYSYLCCHIYMLHSVCGLVYIENLSYALLRMKHRLLLITLSPDVLFLAPGAHALDDLSYVYTNAQNAFLPLRINIGLHLYTLSACILRGSRVCASANVCTCSCIFICIVHVQPDVTRRPEQTATFAKHACFSRFCSPNSPDVLCASE